MSETTQRHAHAQPSGGRVERVLGRTTGMDPHSDGQHPQLPTHRKLWTTPLQTSAQPSTITNSSSLHGSEMIGGLSITIPSPMRIAATARSIATNGR